MENKRIPWNKGQSMSTETKRKISDALKGHKAWNKNIPCTQKHKENISKNRKGIEPWNKGKTKMTDKRLDYERHTTFKKGDNIGKLNHQWKGDDVSYRNLHRWVERKKGKAIRCENCGKIGKGREIQWSNNDHTYKRNIEDWTSLCRKCHGEYHKLLNK